MRRTLLTVAAAAALGLFLTTDASACHKKACAEPVVCAPPAPVCEPVACAPKKHCGFKLPKFKLGCHKKAVCAAPCETYAPVTYAPPVYPTGQTYATGQTH
jgi:hypothetical protein